MAVPFPQLGVTTWWPGAWNGTDGPIRRHPGSRRVDPLRLTACSRGGTPAVRRMVISGPSPDPQRRRGRPHPLRPRHGGRVEPRREIPEIDDVAGSREPEARRQVTDDGGTTDAVGGEVRQRDRAVALGQPLPSGPTTRGTCAHDGRAGRAGRAGGPGSAWRRAGRRPARPPRRPGRRRPRRRPGCTRARRRCGAARCRRRPRDLAVQPVDDRHRLAVGPQAQRRRPALGLAVPATSAAVRSRHVRGRRRAARAARRSPPAPLGGCSSTGR